MRQPIETINPVIGDESFVAVFGRMPTMHDDPRTRVATHVGYVARLLRERETIDPRRIHVLDALDEYVATGLFPDSEADHGLLPTFLDPQSGVRCAVAHLVETTAGSAIMRELDRDHHNAYIADLAGDPRFVAWTESSGLTPAELAIIQPGYPAPPPPDALYTIAVEGDRSVHDDSPATAARSSTAPEALTSIGMLDATLLYGLEDTMQAAPFIELGGKIGITNEEHTAYAAELKLGGSTRVHELRFIYDAGVAIDGYGPELPRAWTVPIDGAIELSRHHHSLDVHGGPRFSLSGDRGTGAKLGVQYRLRDHFCEQGRFDPRDMFISFDANWIGAQTFVGLTVGFGNPRGRQWWEE
jgi:hypothetical protein